MLEPIEPLSHRGVTRLRHARTNDRTALFDIFRSAIEIIGDPVGILNAPIKRSLSGNISGIFLPRGSRGAPLICELLAGWKFDVASREEADFQAD